MSISRESLEAGGSVITLSLLSPSPSFSAFSLWGFYQEIACNLFRSDSLLHERSKRGRVRKDLSYTKVSKDLAGFVYKMQKNKKQKQQNTQKTNLLS